MIHQVSILPNFIGSFQMYTRVRELLTQEERLKYMGILNAICYGSNRSALLLFRFYSRTKCVRYQARRRPIAVHVFCDLECFLEIFRRYHISAAVFRC